jgi:hypothetical protein
MEMSGQLQARQRYPPPPVDRATGTRLIGSRVGVIAVEERRILTLTGIEPRPSSAYPVAMPTELSQLYIKMDLTEIG